MSAMVIFGGAVVRGGANVLHSQRGAYNFTGTLHVAEIFGFRVRWLSCGVVCVILCFAVLVEHRLVTDGRQPDRQEDRHRPIASTAR